MRTSDNIDLSSIDDRDLTSILSGRYRDCGRNMPRSANALRSIAGRLTTALDAQGVSAAQRAGRRAFYRGGRNLRLGARRSSRCGGLVAFIAFRFCADGYRLVVESLETAAVADGSPEAFVAEVYATPATTWSEGACTTKSHKRWLN
jgi:hypothetical protein